MEKITVSTVLSTTIEHAWQVFTQPNYITQWNFASDEWHCPAAQNNLVEEGIFSYTMAAKDGTMSFDFVGKYTQVQEHALIEYTMGDGRECVVTFEKNEDGILVTESFDPEQVNSAELQQAGWQAILNNFRAVAEAEV